MRKVLLVSVVFAVGVLIAGCAQDNSPQVLFQDGTSTGFTLNSLKKRLEKRGGELKVENHQSKIVLSTPALKVELQEKADAYSVLNAYLPGQRPSGLLVVPGRAGMPVQENVEAQGNVKRIFAGLSLGD